MQITKKQNDEITTLHYFNISLSLMAISLLTSLVTFQTVMVYIQCEIHSQRGLKDSDHTPNRRLKETPRLPQTRCMTKIRDDL